MKVQDLDFKEIPGEGGEMGAFHTNAKRIVFICYGKQYYAEEGAPYYARVVSPEDDNTYHYQTVEQINNILNS